MYVLKSKRSLVKTGPSLLLNSFIPVNQQVIQFFLQSIFTTCEELERVSDSAWCALSPQGVYSLVEEEKLALMNDGEQEVWRNKCEKCMAQIVLEVQEEGNKYRKA